MSAPVASKIILPDDTANTGKKYRTTSRVIGSDTVEEPFQRLSSGRHYATNSSLEYAPARFRATSGILSAPSAAAQNGTSSGHLWLYNAPGSGIRAAIRRLTMATQLQTNTTSMTPYRLVAALASGSGTASGAQITPSEINSVGPAAVCTLRTAVTGITVTGIHDICAIFGHMTVGTAAWSYVAPWVQDFLFADDDQPILNAGELLLIYSPDTSIASDTRRWSVDVEWEEFD